MIKSISKSFSLPLIYQRISRKKFNYFSTLINQKVVQKYKYKFQYGVGYKSHPNKATFGGDDYYFVSDNLLAIADGVGAWTQSQNQPTVYASKVIDCIQKVYKNQTKKVLQEPIYAAQEAVKLVKRMGATTLTILTVSPQTGQLRTYYIGDSLYGFFRKQQVQMTTPQMIQFNKPYQVGFLNQKVQNGYQNQYQFSYIANDLIVLATDGLWDNLSLDRIHYQTRGPGSKFKNDLVKSLGQIAQSIVQTAFTYSLRPNYKSPFYIRATQQGINVRKQGKVDDITIIVAKIVKQPISKAQAVV